MAFLRTSMGDRKRQVKMNGPGPGGAARGRRVRPTHQLFTFRANPPSRSLVVFVLVVIVALAAGPGFLLLPVLVLVLVVLVILVLVLVLVVGPPLGLLEPGLHPRGLEPHEC